MEQKSMEEVKHWKEIELFFAKNKCGNIHQIAEAINVHWVTAQKEIQRLEQIGRVHNEGKIYFLNGIDEWQKRINLNDSHTLFIDTMRTTFGDNFVRIKILHKIVAVDSKHDAAHYNLACYYSVSNNQQEAIKYLDLAIKLNSKNAKLASNDPDFANIEESDEFKRLAKNKDG